MIHIVSLRIVMVVLATLLVVTTVLHVMYCYHRKRSVLRGFHLVAALNGSVATILTILLAVPASRSLCWLIFIVWASLVYFLECPCAIVSFERVLHSLTQIGDTEQEPAKVPLPFPTGYTSPPVRPAHCKLPFSPAPPPGHLPHILLYLIASATILILHNVLTALRENRPSSSHLNCPNSSVLRRYLRARTAMLASLAISPLIWVLMSFLLPFFTMIVLPLHLLIYLLLAHGAISLALAPAKSTHVLRRSVGLQASLRVSQAGYDAPRYSADVRISRSFSETASKDLGVSGRLSPVSMPRVSSRVSSFSSRPLTPQLSPDVQTRELSRKRDDAAEEGAKEVLRMVSESGMSQSEIDIHGESVTMPRPIAMSNSNLLAELTTPISSIGHEFFPASSTGHELFSASQESSSIPHPHAMSPTPGEVTPEFFPPVEATATPNDSTFFTNSPVGNEVEAMEIKLMPTLEVNENARAQPENQPELEAQDDQSLST
eukprot:g46504.t1